MEKLKPCPFCGSKYLNEIQLNDSSDEHYIECFECFAKSGTEKTLLHARVRWNKRTPVLKLCPGKDVCRTRSGSCFDCIRSISDLENYKDNFRPRI